MYLFYYFFFYMYEHIPYLVGYVHYYQFSLNSNLVNNFIWILTFTRKPRWWGKKRYDLLDTTKGLFYSIRSDCVAGGKLAPLTLMIWAHSLNGEWAACAQFLARDDCLTSLVNCLVRFSSSIIVQHFEQPIN